MAKCKFCNIAELNFRQLPDGSWERKEKDSGIIHTRERCAQMKQMIEQTTATIAAGRQQSSPPPPPSPPPTLEQGEQEARAVVNIYRDMVKDTNERVKKIQETIADMSNSIELVAIALNVKLPGREPKKVLEG